MKNGWIKLHRVLLDSAVFADAELLRVLLYCVLRASYREMKIPVGRQIITLQPGQLLYGRKAVSDRLGIGESKLRGMMLQLQQLGIIQVQSTNRYSVATIVHWEQYQNEPGKAEFPFDCDFLDDGSISDDSVTDITASDLYGNNQPKCMVQTVLEKDEAIVATNKEPAENHKQEEKNYKIINNHNKKEVDSPGAVLRTVRRYRRADGDVLAKGELASGAAPDEGHIVPGGDTAVSYGNDEAYDIEYLPEIDMSDFEWDVEDDANWGVDLLELNAEAQDPDEQEWIAAHKLFDQLWNRYPIKVGKHKVSDVQIMELYRIGKKTMEQAIYHYKDKKYRVPRKYWMNGSTFFNGGYLDYL